ncbi:glutaredoxin family protein [Chlorogloeopsis sp. ULAP01]|uniref:glutaredoxin family protein n=1 Tax=Chlorogloeopsis sp. ULAP01 TaxID=3056483 RepID=UPI0025AA6875|nr:glutaredoxin family protein [Chlorogloeopsis sp. ULAP01]MDM9382369.1 glutaredoxin family protein [Chlorogloeopsis sp. ULAP01]
MQLILYSKPGCHLCEGLQEKLEEIIQMQNFASVQLEIRDITTREDWFGAYQYEVPVLFVLKQDDKQEKMQPIPRPSPRVTVQQLEKILQKYL